MSVIKENAISGVKWLLNDLGNGIDLQTDFGKNEFLNKSKDLINKIQYDRFIDKDTLLNTCSEMTQFSKEDVQKTFDEIQQKNQQKKIQQECKQVCQEYASQEGDPDLALIKNLQEKLRKLNSLETSTKTPEPYSSSFFMEDLHDTTTGFSTGFSIFKNKFQIPLEAITVIAAQSSHGKTTFMLNLLMRMNNAHNKKTFVYMSLEETSKNVMVKLINQQGGHVEHSQFNQNMLENYLRAKQLGNNPKSIEQWDKASEQVYSIIDEKKILLYDSVDSISEIEKVINELCQKYSIGAVFLDYMQKIQPSHTGERRQLALAEVSHRILNIAKSQKIAIVVGAQLNRSQSNSTEATSRSAVRLDNLRECGDIAQDAELVLGLYNETADKYQRSQSDHKLIIEDLIKLEIFCLKNRNGAPFEPFKMDLNAGASQLLDSQEKEEEEDIEKESCGILTKEDEVKNPLIHKRELS